MVVVEHKCVKGRSGHSGRKHTRAERGHAQMLPAWLCGPRHHQTAQAGASPLCSTISSRVVPSGKVMWWMTGMEIWQAGRQAGGEQGERGRVGDGSEAREERRQAGW